MKSFQYLSSCSCSIHAHVTRCKMETILNQNCITIVLKNNKKIQLKKKKSFIEVSVENGLIEQAHLCKFNSFSSNIYSILNTLAAFTVWCWVSVHFICVNTLLSGNVITILWVFVQRSAGGLRKIRKFLLVEILDKNISTTCEVTNPGCIEARFLWKMVKTLILAWRQ